MRSANAALTYSAKITSSQTQPHKNLATLVTKYQQSQIRDSIPKHAYDAFEKVGRFVADEPIILDSGCGTGASSYFLARQYPDIKVVAIDKSAARLKRGQALGSPPNNLIILQADCVHFWRLLGQQQWQVHQHYLLYPNPWPKPGHLQRRWHAHPIFPTLVNFSSELIMRTNWNTYAQEFAQALTLSAVKNYSLNKINPENPMTPFERKYLVSGHDLFQVHAWIKH